MSKKKSVFITILLTSMFWGIIISAGILYNYTKKKDDSPNNMPASVQSSLNSEKESSNKNASSDSPKTESSQNSEKAENSEKSETEISNQRNASESSSSLTSELTEKEIEAQRKKLSAKRLRESFNALNILLSKELTENSAKVSVDEILQNPELPTGCESVSLTIALKSFGFDIEKTTIAEDYLIYGGDFITSYVGDPFGEDGVGIFPPGLVDTANEFLMDKNSDLTAIDTTGTELEDLYKLLQSGYPVVLWSTMYLESPEFTGDSAYNNNICYPWYTNEHCIVLYGYDKELNTVYISDPLIGYIEYDASYFESIFDEIGKFSMTIIQT